MKEYTYITKDGSTIIIDEDRLKQWKENHKCLWCGKNRGHTAWFCAKTTGSIRDCIGEATKNNLAYDISRLAKKYSRKEPKEIIII